MDTIIDAFETLMEAECGLKANAVGRDFFQRKIKQRMTHCGQSNAGDYLAVVRSSKQELVELIEEMTIPETWFFRNRKQLNAFVDDIKKRKTGAGRPKLQVLSIPCATGEEPYTIAMILLELGLAPEAFHIDAVDISARALKKAKEALYDESSFRGDDLDYRQRFFKKTNSQYRLESRVRDCVSFYKGNVVDKTFVRFNAKYDIIFCRNLFIYLTKMAKNKAAKMFQQVLTENGMLFMGHGENYPFDEKVFTRINNPGVFGYKRITRQLSNEDNQWPSPLTKKSVPPVTPKPGVAPLPPLVVRELPKKQMPIKSPASEIKKVTPRADDADDLAGILEKAIQLANQGELDKALPLCEKLLSQNNVFTEAYFLKGIIFSAKDDNDTARACFNRVLYLNPNHLEATRHLLILAEQQGETKTIARLTNRIKRIKNKVGVA